MASKLATLQNANIAKDGNQANDFVALLNETRTVSHSAEREHS
jgi:hypothetical protein